VAFQRLCGITLTKSDDPTEQRYHISNWFLYYYFSFAAALGNELFYITFLPFLSWCVDHEIAMKMVIIWVFSYYVGQYFKDMLLLPRPPCPPTVRLEHHYEEEYGLPSTHSMAASSLPGLFLFYTYNKFHYPLPLGLVALFIWSASICCSRLYMGVHSIADIVTGLLLGSFLSFFIFIFEDTIFTFISMNPMSPLVVLVFSLVAILIYPRPKKWTNSYGDTSLIVAAGVGTMWGHYFLFGGGREYDGYLPTTIPRERLLIACLRSLIGFATLFLTRALMRKFAYWIVVPLCRPSSKHKKSAFDPSRCYLTEIPVKFFTYVAVGFNAVAGSRLLFFLLGIHDCVLHFPPQLPHFLSI